MELLAIFSPLSIALILIYILYYFDTRRDLKFQNEILDLDVEKKYSINNIKSIFLDTYQFRINIDELNEYNIKRLNRLIEQVQGNLSKKETKYYEPFMFNTILKLFKKQKIYKNDKEKLLTSLSTILDELAEEKKFFGLNTREREILKSLSMNKNLSEVDKRSILELKDIVTNRYQELLKRNEQSNKLSKISIYLGIIGVIIAVVGFYK
ncbi:hypothetical protein L5F32_06660 [Aliarcobacter butzleri]|uniref:hypothetical protein n=1 Tax=Aliarcobacter butzleri TaxID=28197 RepID=UPI001EDC0358|nr:hypothetical protein [Aliarcobacter butzleri]MCG3651950.1 hypothetical protein [Aliarcobacter butzleri]